MMYTVITLMQLLITISATAPHARLRHSGPVASGSVGQDPKAVSLHEKTEEAAKRVHEAAAAARKTAHGDGSDSFANFLEKSVMQLEKKDHEMHARADERKAQHEIEHQVEKRIQHAHEVAHERSLHMSTEEAAKGVHAAAAAARKTAHGDGSDSFANYLEKTMVQLEEKDHEMHARVDERKAQHELDRKVEKQIQHAHQVAHERSSHMTSDEAFKQLHETAEGIRKKAHGDGSDRFANMLEDSMADLEELKHENEFKAQERHAQHEHDHEMREDLLHAQAEAKAKARLHEREMQEELLHAQAEAALAHKHEAEAKAKARLHDREMQEELLHAQAEAALAHLHDREMEEELLHAQAEAALAKHKLMQAARESEHKPVSSHEAAVVPTQPRKSQGFMARNNHIVVVAKPVDNQLPGLTDESLDEEIVQSGAALALFLFIAAFVFVVLQWKKFANSNTHSVKVPGLGKVNVVQSDMVMGLFGRNGFAPNAGHYL